MSSMLQSALDIAKNGQPVFPVSQITKKPITKHGFHDATIDPDIIQAWWHENPNANIAIPTGGKFFVLDVDIHGDIDGRQTLEELIAQYDPLPDTTIVQTGSGGLHYYFLMPDFDLRNSSNKLGPGLDIRGNGGYVVVPPSIHETGKPYEKIKENPIPSAPEWLIILLKEISTDEHFIPSKFTKTDGLPGNEYNERGDVESLLAKHGWQKVKDFAAKEYWCRPGKRKGTSATFQKDMRIFYCFTGNAPPLEADKAYSPFSLYAVLEHGGDYTAAAKRLREEGYGGSVIQAVEPPGDFVTAKDLSRKKKEMILPDSILDYHFIAQGVEAFTCEGSTGVIPYALATTIGFIAHAIGNQATLGECASNLFILKCGPSSAGKSFNETLMNNHINHNLFNIATDMASASAILHWFRRMIERKVDDMYDFNRNEPVGLYLMDEGEQILSSKDPTATEIRKEILELFNFLGKKIKPYASEDRTFTVPKPHLTILANATLNLFDSLEYKDAESGFLPRFLVFVHRELPKQIIYPGNAIFRKNLGRFLHGLEAIRKALVPDSYLQTRELDYDAEAREYYETLFREHHLRLEKLKDSQGTLIGKYPQFLHKLSLVAHAAKHKEQMLFVNKVEKDSLEWAHQTISTIYAQSGVLFDEILSTGNFDRDCKRFVSGIEKCIEHGKLPTLSSIKKFKRPVRNWKPQYLKAVLETLGDQVYITQSRKKTEVYNLLKKNAE